MALDRALVLALTAWAALSLLPVGAWTGAADVSYYAAAWGLWVRALGVASLVAALVLLLAGGEPIGRLRALLGRAARVRRAPFLVVLGALAAGEAAAVSASCFARNPPAIDVWIQYLQARIFLSGGLTAPPPPSVAHFGVLHTLVTDRGWFTQFPPLHPALLAVGMRLGAPWLVTPLLAALFPAAVYQLGSRTGDERVARLAATLGLLSPFVVAMDASGMNHLPAALCVAGGLAAVPGAARGRPAAGLALGAAAGLTLGLRPLDAAVLASVGALALLSARRHIVPVLVATVCAGFVCALPTLLFNAATTGQALRFGYLALYGPALALGFHAAPWGPALTPRRALGLVALDAHQLNVFLLEWPLPATALLVSGLWLRGGRLDHGLRTAAAYLVALVVALFCYFHRDTLFGPRFLFSALPAVLVLLASALIRLVDVERRLPWRRLRVGDVALVGLATTALLSAAFLAPARLASYSITGTPLALHPDVDAARAGLRRALVLVPDGWGTRLIARLWAAGMPIADADRLYHAVDACTLEETLSRSDADGVRDDALLARLRETMRGADPGIPVPGTTPDPRLRLPADGRLARRCAEEIARDRLGTLQFTALAWLNTPALDGDVVWAREMGAGDALLRRLYPDRTVYRYAPGVSGMPAFTPVASALVRR